MLKTFREQPRAFSMIFMLEIWERFGFYTVQGILTLYFIRFLGFDDTQAYYTFGAFSALVYGMVAFGGFLGDKVLGTKRTIVLGLITLCFGYLALALATKQTVFYALGLVCVGNGLFKANPSNLLAKCYEPRDQRLHSGFTLYYMAVNLGSIFSLTLGPALATNYGYFYAYFLSFIGLMLGVLNYFYRRSTVAHINNEADLRKIDLWHWAIVVVGLAVITCCSAYLLQHVLLARNLLLAVSAVVTVWYFMYCRGEDRATVMRMIVAFILMLEAVIYFVLYQQMPTSLNLFAVNNVHAVLFGIHFDPQSFQALNPFWIVLLSPVLARFYISLQRKGVSMQIPQKFTAGMMCCAFGFGILYFARFFHTEQGIVSSWWLVVSYFFQSTGELLVSALGVAMVAELVPAQITGFVMGMWFLTSAVAGFLGAWVANLTALPEHIKPGIESLTIYTDVFAAIGIVTLIFGILMWMLSPKLNRLLGDTKKDIPTDTLTQMSII